MTTITSRDRRAESDMRTGLWAFRDALGECRDECQHAISTYLAGAWEETAADALDGELAIKLHAVQSLAQELLDAVERVRAANERSQR